MKKLLICCFTVCLSFHTLAQTPFKVKNDIPFKTTFFPLQDVRLLPSAFKDAMNEDAKYLLSLEPDRFLHRFRVNAGLNPKAPIYGGWGKRGSFGTLAWALSIGLLHDVRGIR